MKRFMLLIAVLMLALARGLKEEIARQFPEIAEMNAKETKLFGLEPALERAVRRIDNRQVIGIGTPIAGIAGGVVAHSTGWGVAIGALKAVLDKPMLKSKLAIVLNRAAKGTEPFSVSQARVAAYVTALANAEESVRNSTGRTNSEED